MNSNYLNDYFNDVPDQFNTKILEDRCKTEGIIFNPQKINTYSQLELRELFFNNCPTSPSQFAKDNGLNVTNFCKWLNGDRCKCGFNKCSNFGADTFALMVSNSLLTIDINNKITALSQNVQPPQTINNYGHNFHIYSTPHNIITTDTNYSTHYETTNNMINQIELSDTAPMNKTLKRIISLSAQLNKIIFIKIDNLDGIETIPTHLGTHIVIFTGKNSKIPEYIKHTQCYSFNKVTSISKYTMSNIMTTFVASLNIAIPSSIEFVFVSCSFISGEILHSLKLLVPNRIVKYLNQNELI